MTALLAAPLCLSAGAAIDFSMATVTRTHLQQIADGAALAGGREFDGTNLDEATKIAEDYIASYQSEIPADTTRSEEHTSELQSLMRISYAVFCLKKKNKK